jgi:tetratricopeptide (TPR) repeat protein
MQKLSVRILVIFFLSAFCGLSAQRTPAPKPLHDSELLALVGGNALPENIVARLNSGGIDFLPSPEYRALLRNAGATDEVLAATEKTHVAPQASQTASSAALLQHLSVAAQLANEKKYEDAIKELDSAVTGGDIAPETAFVLGRILVDTEDYESAFAVYSKLLEIDPSFPEAHTKLSFVCHRAGDDDEAIHQAKLALQATPNNAEAHKFAGLALAGLGKYDAAKAEYKEALRLKPIYESAHYDMGILYGNINDTADAIFEYKQAIATDPNDVNAHYNYGVTLGDAKDFDAAIREYHIAKKLDPSRFDIRQNLSSSLIEKQDMPAAIVELREMEAMFPDSAICHGCLGTALAHTGDLDGAEKEFRAEIRLEPGNAMGYADLGYVAYSRQKYDDAIAQYRNAEQLDQSNFAAHAMLGQIYLMQKHDLNAAIEECKQAEALSPSDPSNHANFGVALAEAGRTAEAISEFREAVALDPNDLGSSVDLAKAFEASHNWPAALAEYRKAALSFTTANMRKGVAMVDGKTPQQQYEDAQNRYSQYLQQLESSGKSAEAAAIEKQILAGAANPSLSKQMDDAMLAGATAMNQKQPDEARRQLGIAVKLGEQIQPHDERLIHALDAYGRLNIGIDAAVAQSSFEREMKVINELFGDNDPDLEGQALRSLAGNAAAQKEFDAAVNFYTRALAVDEKTYGEHSAQVGNELRLISRLYEVQNQFDKAEPYLLRDVRNAETTGDDQHLQIALWNLAFFYDRWGKKPQETIDCQTRVIALLERTYGPNSFGLAQPLESEEKALRALGRNGEADQIAARLKTIQAAPASLNQHQ